MFDIVVACAITVGRYRPRCKSEKSRPTHSATEEAGVAHDALRYDVLVSRAMPRMTDRLATWRTR